LEEAVGLSQLNREGSGRDGRAIAHASQAAALIALMRDEGEQAATTRGG